MNRSSTVGIPSRRLRPSGFGISTRFTGCGRYFPTTSCVRISRQCCFRYPANASTSIASMPGAPWFLLTCCSARCRFARASTRPINVKFNIDSGQSRSPASGSSHDPSTPGSNRFTDALPLLFTYRLRLPSFGPSVGASQPTMPSADFCKAFRSAPASRSRCTATP